jgi:hypothetical protein
MSLTVNRALDPLTHSPVSMHTALSSNTDHNYIPTLVPSLLFIFSGSAAQRGLWPPVALQPSAGYGLLVPRGFVITHNDAPQSVGLLCTSDQVVAET